MSILYNKNAASKVLLMCLADPSVNPRPRRVARTLGSMGFTVDIASYAIKSSFSFNRHFMIPPVIKCVRFKIIRKFIIGLGLLLENLGMPSWYVKFIVYSWFRLGNIEDKIINNQYKLLIVEDLFLLPLAFACKSNAKVLFDAREYYPRQREESLMFRIFEKPLRTRLCRDYLIKCDKVITVSNGLADEYFREFSVHAEVIRSTPFLSDFSPKAPRKDNIRLVHHGASHENRGLENMIYLMRHLDKRFTLDLFLTPDNDYLKYLKMISQDDPRITFQEPVPFDLILPTLSKYDIGIIFYISNTFNIMHCLPNKFFEFIQARLMLLISPLPEMSKIVREYDCGIVAGNCDFSMVANILNNISADEIMIYKNNSNIAAAELNWECERMKFCSIINSLIM